MEGKKQFIAVIFALLVLAGLFFIPYSESQAQVSSGILPKPFGGKIITKVDCDCSGFTWIVVGPPVPGSFIITPATRIYREYRIEIGRWVLGLADLILAPCMKKDLVCVPVGWGFPVRIIGTS